MFNFDANYDEFLNNSVSYFLKYNNFLMIDSKIFSFYILNKNELQTMILSYDVRTLSDDYFVLYKEDEYVATNNNNNNLKIKTITNEFIIIPFENKIKWKKLKIIIKKEMPLFFEYNQHKLFNMINISTFNKLKKINKFDIILISDENIEELI